MRRFFAATFATAFLDLELLQSEALFDEDDTGSAQRWREQVSEKLRSMARNCREAGFDRLAERCTRLAETCRPLETIVVCHLLRDLLPDIQSEMARHMYFLVPENRKGFYQEDDKPLFGEAVAMSLPDTTAEIAEAGRCLALARWTACVFHLMRATELALHQWSADLGVPLKVPAAQANMQEILTAADNKLREIGIRPRSPQRDADLEYFGETSAHFRALKDAWRNHTAHAKTTYDERGALSVWGHVRDFMVTLSARTRP
jgi:hypothetical protein